VNANCYIHCHAQEKNSTAKKPDERVALKPLTSNNHTALKAAKREGKQYTYYLVLKWLHTLLI